MGAYEFVETASSDIDLVITSIQAPETVFAGDLIQLNWRITNLGTGYAQGPWHDTVNLVLNRSTIPTIIPAGDYLVGDGVTLGYGESLDVSMEVRVPGSIADYHDWQIIVNSRGEVFEGQNQANNGATTAASFWLDLPELTVGGPGSSGQFSDAGESHWFKFTPGPGEDILVSLDLSSSSGSTELYLGRGFMPTRQVFDARSPLTGGADVAALAASTQSQAYYVLAYARQLPSAPLNFSVSAQALQLSINSFQPASVSNQGSSTLAISGWAAFEPDDFRGR